MKQIFLYKTHTAPHPSLLSDVGLSDIPGEAMVKLYCPKCMDVYTPKSSRHHHTDGAYFGTGFPHMLFMVHPEYRPKRPANQFVPRCVWSDSIVSINMPLIVWVFGDQKEKVVSFCYEHFMFLFQAIWFQNSPNGLSTPTSGCIKFQEPGKDNSLELYFNESSGLCCCLLLVWSDGAYNPSECLYSSPNSPPCW